MIICTRCQTQNRDIAHFCKECGQFLDAACPNCANELPSNSRYCDFCGLKLENQASLTGWTGKSSGEPLTGIQQLPQQPAEQPTPAAESAKSNALRRFLPHELAAKLEAARVEGQMAGERRVVTMLFCDIKGSTAAAEQLDPEEWTEIINGAFEQMIQPIYKYEGTVARLMGDAILAFFGAPIAHEDDPLRAVLAGLDIVAGFDNYQKQVFANFGLHITPRVGINTGMVVVGAVGSDLRMEYTAMGDAINLAARMEQTAEPGTVQIAEDTYKHIAPLFEVEDLGGITVKGKSEPVNAYRVVQRKAQPGQQRGIAGMKTRLIGRERELAQLLAAAGRLQAGVGSVACLTGEAGLGKSRLVHELQEHWQAAPGTNGRDQNERPQEWHEAVSFSYETVHPYALFQRLLRRMIGIVNGEAAAVAQEKVARQAAMLPADQQAQISAVLGSLLGLSLELDGEEFKRELFACLSDFFRCRFAVTPGVLVLDDMHWSDSASIELLLHLLPLVSELPLLLICVMRADQEAPGWQIKLAVEGAQGQQGLVIELDPLSPDDSSSLVEDLLAITDLPDALRAQVLEKSGGNPLFVEEVVRTLIDQGMIQQDESGDRWIVAHDGHINIPGSIQSLLTARIDRLEEDVRHTLQLAAVIGRSFYRRVLQHVARLELGISNNGDQVIKTHLSILQVQQMILETARIPEQTYIFRHALTQEAAYNTILLRQRRAYHLRAGNALEELFSTDLEENAPMLAHHFWESGDDERAFRYLVMAGSQAFRLYALQEALIHYDQALEIARRTADVDRDLRIELARQRGRALELRGLHEQALIHYQEMQIQAEESDDGPLALESMTAQATLYNIPSAVSDHVKGEEMARTAQQLAHNIGDWEAAAKLLWTLMLGATWMSDNPEKGIEYGEASLRLAREHDLQRQLAYTVNDLATVYMSVGRVDDARMALEEAQARFAALDNRPMLAQAHRMSGTLFYTQGEFEEAKRKMAQALEIDRPIENQWGILANVQARSSIDFERGDIGKAVEGIEWALQEAIAMSLGPMTLLPATCAALIYSLAGDWQAALEVIQKVQVELAVDDFYPTWAWSIRTLVLLDQGDVGAAREANKMSQIDFDPRRPLKGGIVYAPITIRLANIGVSLAISELGTALIDVDELLVYLERMQLPLFRPEALYLKGRILRQQGRPSAARSIWLQAKSESEAMGERKMRWRILAALAEVTEDVREKSELLQSARDVATTIAANAGRSEHNHSFLSRPDVQRLLAANKGVV